MWYGGTTEASRAAPRIRAQIDDHLAVSGHVRRHALVTQCPVILPATAYVHQVELALRIPLLLNLSLDVLCEHHSQLKNWNFSTIIRIGTMYNMDETNHHRLGHFLIGGIAGSLSN